MLARSLVTGILAILTSFQSLTAQSLDCDFDSESGSCGWKPVTGRWVLSYSRGGYRTGPESDHTTGNGGYMIMIDSSRDGKPATLMSPFVKSNTGTCLTFWYNLYGFEVDTLTVYRMEQGEVHQELFQVSGNQGKRWYKAVVETGSGNFALMITATYKRERNFGNIAIDDISFSEGNCQKEEVKTNRPVLDCDFEEDFCFWAAPYMDSWGMERKTVSPEDIFLTTFPPGSNGSSFLNFRRLHYYHRQDVLMAPAVPIGKDGACLSFWYGVYPARGEIQRFAIKKSGFGMDFSELNSEGETLLELINEDQRKWFNHDAWNFAQVDLPPGKDYFIYFHLIFNRRGDTVDYIKIDDIKLHEDGSCKPEFREAMVNCNFDKDYCRWFPPSQVREPTWIRRKGRTPMAFTGPPSDHTTGDGYYIHFRHPRAYSDSTKIRTLPFYVSPQGACLTFWYYMYGEDIKSISLSGYLMSTRYFSALWELDGNQGDQWIQQNISISLQGEVYLMFTATKGYFPRADIALDDISISFDGLCEKDISTTTTESTTETVTTTAQAPKWLPSPVLTIKSDTKPALINSRVEIICGDHLEGASYTWLKKDEHEFRAIEGQEDRSLIYDNIKRSQEGTYMCSVAKEGYLNAESKTFEIEVELRQLLTPFVTVVGMANPVYQNSRIELLCQNPNNITELSYEWQKWQGSKKEMLSEKSSTLVFDEIQLGDAASYSCFVSKDDYLSANSEKLEIIVVKDPRPVPWLYHNLGSLPIQVNVRIEFKCGNEVVERGVYHWKTDSAAFASSPLPQNRTFIIEKSDPSHNGYYSCRISKDGYFTAKSRTIQVKAAPGKPCKSRYSCWGNVHSGKCVNKRCECSSRAVLRGNDCVERPRAPTISVSPDYKTFAYGETFYLICKVREPVSKSLTYKFRKSSSTLGREGELKTYYIHKIANATSQDFGSYTCDVSEDGIPSDYSESVYIVIKEFADLNCDFEMQDTCSWLHVDEPHAVNFTVEEESSKGLSNSFLRMPQSMDMQISMTFLRSPTIHDTILDSCLRFRYRMHGHGVYSLAVWEYSKLWQHFPDRRNLWTAIGDQGDQWVENNLTIKRHGKIYLQFEAVGDVAIDDIQFLYRGSCSDHGYY